MRNDLSTEITGRVERLLDGLSTIFAWRRLPTLPPLGQRLYTRYSDWTGRLFSRPHSPLTSASLLSRSSNLWPLPLSYAWFNRQWIDRKKKPRSFWNQSDDRKGESIQRLSVPEYFFEEDAEEGLIKQFQSSQSESADDIILSIPTLMTLSAGNIEFTRLAQLAKKFALRLELLTNKGYPTSWQIPFEGIDMPYYPGLVTNNSPLDKNKEIIASQRSSHLEETFYHSSPAVLSSLSPQPASGQYIGPVLMPVPGKFLLAERIPTKAKSPFIPSFEGMNSYFEPSGALPTALSSQPESEANITSLSYLPEFPLMTSNSIPTGKALVASFSHLSQSPSMTLNDVPTRKVFSRLQSLFKTPPVASSANLMGKMLVDSHLYSSEPPQAASDVVLTGKADITPISYPELVPLFGSEVTPYMASAAYHYVEMLAPQPTLDKTLGSHQTLSLHWPAGNIPPSLIGDTISQEMGGPVKDVASTINNNSFGGYNTGLEVGLALAPIGRSRGNTPAATSNTANAGQERALETVGETMPALDPEALALEVYSILKRRLIVERERTTSVLA